MPKIVISEYDNTRAGSTPYANFSVVVPGIVKARTKKDDGKWYYGGKTIGTGETAEDDNGVSVFDENDIYECSSREDFVNFIGKCAPDEITIQTRKAPTTKETPRTLTETEFNTLKVDSNAPLYAATAKEAGTPIGYLVDETYSYEKVAPDTVWDEARMANQKFAQIVAGNEGSDGEDAKLYGNQIAYELLGLGYTVLYKKVESATEIGTEDFWSCLKDKGLYDFRYVISGLLDKNGSVNNVISALVTAINGSEDTGRGDCIALLDIDSTAYTGTYGNQAAAIANIKTYYLGSAPSSQYVALFAPYVNYVMDDSYVKDFGGNKTFPASFHYLACAARAAENYKEWYAIAGFTRGVSKYTIESVGCKFGESAVDILEPRNSDKGVEKAVNLIVKIKNAYYLWGNRTSYKLENSSSEKGDLVASHFLNIRQLCTTIKKQVYVACRKFTFDPNSDLLWINFCNAIKPTLESMKADQGISDYKFIKVKSSKKAVLSAKIRIVPIEAVEDFDIKLYLEDSIGGITTTVEEE